jgi:Icc-related predicted phosphoesterase
VIIAATSDLHGYLPDPPSFPCDMVIVAGDIMPDKRPFEKQADWLDREFRHWETDIIERPVYKTWGNHDFAAERLMVPSDLEGLVDRTIVADGIRFYFTPWVPHLPKWAYSCQEDVPNLHRAAIPADTQVLVSHGPPLGYGDATSGFIEEHVGSETLLNRCAIIQPPIIICGHIHEGRGSYETFWGGTIYNVSALNRYYKPYQQSWTRIDTSLHGL